MKNLQGQTRESAARPHVGEPTAFQRYGSGCIHTLANMTIKYLQRVADGGQVYLLIPHQQNLYILLNLQHLFVSCRELKLSECALNDASGRRGWGCCWHISKSLFLVIQRFFPCRPPGFASDIEVPPSPRPHPRRCARKSPVPGNRSRYG